MNRLRVRLWEALSRGEEGHSYGVYGGGGLGLLLIIVVIVLLLR